ncbi:hypothetical protein IKP85_05995 [bacterium]|nr:hypothetical protein [bacterium]
MDAINHNSRVNFTAQIKLAKGLGEGNKTLIKACNVFSAQSAPEDSRVLHMWEDNGVYKFDFETKNELSPTTQYVGRDVMGYLFMEKGWKGIKDFFDTTLRALEARAKHNTGNIYKDNINANIDAAIEYLRSKSIGNKVKTVFEDNTVDYDKAGACLHLD